MSETERFIVDGNLYCISAAAIPHVVEAIRRACDEFDARTAEETVERGFNVGDVVRLKSGGPVMTITEIDGDSVYVTWLRRLDSLDSWDAIPQYDATAAREDFPLSCLKSA